MIFKRRVDKQKELEYKQGISFDKESIIIKWLEKDTIGESIYMVDDGDTFEELNEKFSRGRRVKTQRAQIFIYEVRWQRGKYVLR